MKDKFYENVLNVDKFFYLIFMICYFINNVIVLYLSVFGEKWFEVLFIFYVMLFSYFYDDFFVKFWSDVRYDFRRDVKIIFL